ncbi:hypothetical protein [Candidatus Protochlamydia phocaeensis]|uniref:hypothetical protein n=1 Tax=Candidatus Protochlamydia phocaeensis TaxID=1414722 RepID=UPI000837D37D|nr:hypothetical protein [Candidatus Protochlamydia phocaeensis]
MLTLNPIAFSSFVNFPALFYKELSKREKLIAVISAVAAGIIALFSFYKLYSLYKHYVLWPQRIRKLNEEGIAEKRVREAAGRYFPIKGVFDSDPLERSHDRLVCMWNTFHSRLTHKEAWKDPVLITQFTHLMERAGDEIDLIFHQLDELTENEPDKPAKMANILTFQAYARTDYNFCYKYFRCSVTQLYHLARGYVYFNGNYYQGTRNITDAEKAPFYTPGTPQNRWREIYNRFCEKIDLYHMRGTLQEQDERFLNWANPDLRMEDPFSPFPDTTPT